MNCKYCLNPDSKSSLEDGDTLIWHTPQSLYDKVKIDNICFLTTGGGICFGGGEPLLHYDFIKAFRKLCNADWNVTIETSLNVPLENVYQIANIVDQWIIDIKDMNANIYRNYTDYRNNKIIKNLRWLSENGFADRVLIRMPHIPNYNTAKCVEASESKLRKFGYHRFEKFDYVLPEQLAAYRKRQKFKPTQYQDKNTCAVLKAIRQIIADKNEILFHPHICNYEGACLGTCPVCEQEVIYIEKELKKNAKTEKM